MRITVNSKSISVLSLMRVFIMRITVNTESISFLSLMRVFIMRITVEPLYSTIGGVHGMGSCYWRIMVKQYDVVMIVTSWQKRIMITRSKLTVVMWAPCPWSHLKWQGMQHSYETYSSHTWPFCQSNCTLVNPGHRNDKSYLFLPNYRRKRHGFAHVDLCATMFSFPSCVAVDSVCRLFHNLSRNHAGHQHVKNYARNQLECGTD